MVEGVYPSSKDIQFSGYSFVLIFDPLDLSITIASLEFDPVVVVVSFHGGEFSEINWFVCLSLSLATCLAAGLIRLYLLPPQRRCRFVMD